VSQSALTHEQAAAVAAGARDVLVEAGAGTGKTAVMVERYCRLVCEQGVSPDVILAFTFTEKAAAELRQRIRAELARRALQGSERAQGLLAGIGGSWVMTIHGFCNRLLASHPVAAGIDPRFRVLDAPEAERAAREAFEDALEDFLAASEDSREDTVAAFEVEGLREIVTAAYAELRSRGVSEPRLPEPPRSDPPAAAIRRAAEAAAEALEELKPGDPKRERLERAVATLRVDRGALPSLAELRTLRTTSSARALAAYREAIETAIARTAEAGEGGIAYRHLATLLELYSARFEAAKERRSGVDFEDLQILATQLLEQTEIGTAYRSRFGYLMVDEFQDTNRLQLRLIEALRGPGAKLMTVGDELQSIYGFRHADLEVFREQRRANAERQDAETMELSGNFRSRPEVIGAVNELGGALFGESFRALRVGAAAQRAAALGEGPAVKLLRTARDGWEIDQTNLASGTDGRTPLSCLAEARFLAGRLREHADAGAPRSEMVVLLRAFTHLDAYEDSLERVGLRPYVVGGRGYWSHQQVADVGALLATIANPLDDQALLGALASPACGLAPDTLWLLRAAAGRGRHLWPAAERAIGFGNADLAGAERLAQIPGTQMELLRRFAETLRDLRERGTRLSLAGLIEAAITETGYDLAVLMRPSGEARFANVRKLMRVAAEFESREGRDLRGLLDFLAARAEAGAEAQAATAVEGHDGVRIMTVHSAKGLEFGVVAVPDLSRSLLAGSRAPLLTIGRGGHVARVGMQLRCLGAASINLYDYDELREQETERDAEEGLRLFHVAATRARERLILSGVVKPQSGPATTSGTPVIERIAKAFAVERNKDSSITIAPPQAREDLEVDFEPSEIAVRANLPSPEQAAKLAQRRREGGAERPLGEGPAPLIERHPPAVASRPLSYTAISAYEDCPYRFYMERVLGLRQSVAEDFEGKPSARQEGAARGAVVHALLQWSQANGWREPSEELARRHALAIGLDHDFDRLLAPVRGWLGSKLLGERIGQDPAGVRAEAPLLLGVAGSVLRGSIDLLVERQGLPPLVVDYKTDRLQGLGPAEHMAGYGIQRDIYALAVAEARGASEVEVAYVFLERPSEPQIAVFGPAELREARKRLAAVITRIGAGEFPVVPPSERSWSLCNGCTALSRLCSGPAPASPPARQASAP